ncbi:transposase [Rhizocola hellebori]|uniref:transposase n=1 Tax=Rhizocola hellebori TaxID=1392758 RepID=UPI003570ECBB
MWEIVQPLLLVPARRRQRGGRRRTDDRAVLAAVMVYMVRTGCSWRVLPAAMFGLLVVDIGGRDEHRSGRSCSSHSTCSLLPRFPRQQGSDRFQRPFSARTEIESTTARAQAICPASPRRCNT